MVPSLTFAVRHAPRRFKDDEMVIVTMAPASAYTSRCLPPIWTRNVHTAAGKSGLQLLIAPLDQPPINVVMQQCRGVGSNQSSARAIKHLPQEVSGLDILEPSLLCPRSTFPASGRSPRPVAARADIFSMPCRPPSKSEVLPLVLLT